MSECNFTDLLVQLLEIEDQNAENIGQDEENNMQNKENDDKMKIPPYQEDDNTELVDSSDENSNQFDNLDDSCEYDCDLSLNFKVINSMKFEIMKLDRYEKIYENIQKRILS